MKSIVCFGEALIDFLANPQPDSRESRLFHQHAGGAPANVAVAVARLGGRAEFVGMFGADMFGDFLIERLHAMGVGTRYTRRTDAAKTALAFVALDAHGERSFSFYRPPAADLLFRESDFDTTCFAQAGIFHVCSNSLTDADIAQATLHGMALARAAGALVSMDMNLRPSLWPASVDPLPRLWQALGAADLVKLADEEFAYLCAHEGGEEATLERLLATARVVIVTHGAEPLRWFARTCRGSVAVVRAEAIDTTAAGDAFVGGLLFHLIEHGVATPASLEATLTHREAWAQALRFAAACGAHAVMRQGAFAAMPTYTEVQALLAQNASIELPA